MKRLILVTLPLTMTIILLLTACSSTPSFDSATKQLLQSTLDSCVTEAGVPGATLTVVGPDGATWVGVSGVSDVQNNTAMVPGLKFRIGSVTKTFTAVVTLQLVQEGRLSLDQTLDSLLPGIVPNAAQISLRQLLNHTSGLFDYLQAQDPSFLYGIFLDPLKKWTPESCIAVANANTPYFAPGEGFHYSNTNYVLLGMIIEKITGKTFAQEVTSRILVPLGLKNTLVPETPDMPAGSTHGYTWDSKWVDTTRIETSWASSAGNMISDSADLLVWLKALMQGTLLDKKTKEEMFTFVDIAPNMGYGLGLEKQGESIGHTGDIVFGGQAAMYQLKGWQLVVLVNSSPSKPAAAPFGSEYIMAKVIVALGLVQ